MNNHQEHKQIGQLLKDLLSKGNQLKGGVAITASGPGGEVAVRFDGVGSSLRVKAGNNIEAGKQVLVAFDSQNKALIAINPNPPSPGNPTIIERSENQRSPKSGEKKETAIVPILVSKTVGEELPEKPECTCTHYAIGKIRGSRAFSYETCDGTTPGASKDKEALEQSGSLAKIYYWFFDAWNGSTRIPWITNPPVCEEPFIPSHPDILFYGSRQQTFQKDPLQPLPEPRTLPYTASNMYLLEVGPIAQYFGGDPSTRELNFSPEVQDLMWGFHLVADEQAIVTATGRKFEIKPTTLTEHPVLTSPVTAIANAKAWKSGSAFGGVVRLITNQGAFDPTGWIVAFGEPVDLWYDANDVKTAAGRGVKREIGVTLRTLPAWNRVPWQLVVDPEVCPRNPLVETMFNETPTDPDNPNKYLMTKWFVGGITEQWLELPVTHRVDDPHYAMISCNSEKKKIWVSIKTGLDPLNTYEEKTEWFINSDETIDATHGMADNAGIYRPIPIQQPNGKIFVGSFSNIKNNFKFLDDEIIDSRFFDNNLIYSNKRIQFSNQGARFCKLQLIEINISENGTLSISDVRAFTYENKHTITKNEDNWNHENMTTFLAFLGNYVYKESSGLPFNSNLRGSGDLATYSFWSNESSFDLYNTGILILTFSDDTTASFILSNSRRKTNPFLSGLLSFFGELNNSYAPRILKKIRPNSYWSSFFSLHLGSQNKKILSAMGVFTGRPPIYYSNFDDSSSTFTFTSIELAEPFLFMPVHILGTNQKDSAIQAISNDTSRGNFITENVVKFQNAVLYRRKFGVINHVTAQERPYSTNRNIKLMFWDREKIDNLIDGEEPIEQNIITQELIDAIEKEKVFSIKKSLDGPFPSSYFDDAAISANLSHGNLCCFDFMRGYQLPVDEMYRYSGLYSRLALLKKPIECPVYICEFDKNDNLKDYNIYNNKTANALVYPFDYTEGEPCSFTVWGAAPALMKLKKT